MMAADDDDDDDDDDKGDDTVTQRVAGRAISVKSLFEAARAILHCVSKKFPPLNSL